MLTDPRGGGLHPVAALLLEPGDGGYAKKLRRPQRPGALGGTGDDPGMRVAGQHAAAKALDPEMWLEDALHRIHDHKVCQLHELMPQYWKLAPQTVRPP